MKNIEHSRAGFSLVELLVYMAIFAVLVSMAFVGINIAQRSGRDQERKLTSEQLVTEINSYFRLTGAYPVETVSLVWTTDKVTIGSKDISLSGIKKYNSTVTDATQTAYTYKKDRSGFIVCVKLEVGDWYRAGSGGDSLTCP